MNRNKIRIHIVVGSHRVLAILFVGACFFTQSCGVVGPPIAPEDIGIEAKIRAQKKADQEAAQQDEPEIVPLSEEEVPLPPLRRVGSQ